MEKDREIREPGNRSSQSGRANALTVAIILGFLYLNFGFPRQLANGQGHNNPFGPNGPNGGSDGANGPRGDSGPGGPHPEVKIPVEIQVQPVAPTPSIIIPPPPGTVVTPIVVPTDVTNPQITNPNVTKAKLDAYNQSLAALALAGIQQIPLTSFPGQDKVGKNYDWITVLAKEGADFSKPNNYTADLKGGDIIVSVKNPSHLAFVKTPYGDIAVGANSDVMVTYNQGVLHILNFDGEGKILKVKLDQGFFAGPADPTVTIAPGYELVACERVLTRAEMRPRDGIARRYGKALEHGHMAISQFSLESAAHSVGMLLNLQQTTTGIKERRILSDLSKMAAILNYRNGEYGYTAEK
jgi:hypothetical protein